MPSPAPTFCLNYLDIAPCDVLVVGAGLAGVCAALASARTGAKTALVEALPYLGGNGVIGLPWSTFRARKTERLVVAGIPLEIVERLRKRGACMHDPLLRDWLSVDGEVLQIELSRMLDDAGVFLVTHSPLLAIDRRERRVTGGLFYSKETPFRIEAGHVVDASGDAQAATLAGLQTPMGRARDGKTQPMTLTFTLGGVVIEEVPPWKTVNELWDTLRPTRKWRNPRTDLCGPTPLPGRPGHYSFNVTRIAVEKGTDSRLLTEAEKEGRYQIDEFVEGFLRPHVPGFQTCHLAQIGQRIGVRETRRIVGQYELQKEDILSLKRFDDAIACNSYPVDIHSPDGGGTEYEKESLPVGGYYTIPYRSLVASEVDNLLACGRCLSASHEAISAVRVLSAAMATGQAAGTAAALATCIGTTASELDPAALRERLVNDGAIVE